MKTKNMQQALSDLRHYGNLSIHPDGISFTAKGEHGGNRHSLHTIQQLISDQLVSYKPAEKNPKTGYITRIYLKN